MPVRLRKLAERWTARCGTEQLGSSVVSRQVGGTKGRASEIVARSVVAEATKREIVTQFSQCASIG